MTPTMPTFLVIGAARSGTTGLVEGLRTHPRVFVTDPKEPHYFALHRIGARFTAPGDEQRHLSPLRRDCLGRPARRIGRRWQERAHRVTAQGRWPGDGRWAGRRR